MTIEDDINTAFGAGSVFRLGERASSHQDVIPTGSVELDNALGIGGVPRGRVIEIYGSESSGKTSLAQHIIASGQSAGLTCALIDAEHSLDPGYAKAIGVDIDQLRVSQPSSGEEGLDIAYRLLPSCGVIVIDSVAALVPLAEIEGEMGQQGVGLQPRLMGRALRKIIPQASQHNTLVVFINQEREAVNNYGPALYTPGGKALRFFAAQRLRLAIVQRDKGWQRVKVRVTKNKLSAPYKEAEFRIRYGVGIESIKRRQVRTTNL